MAGDQAGVHLVGVVELEAETGMGVVADAAGQVLLYVTFFTGVGREIVNAGAECPLGADLGSGRRIGSF